MIRQLILLGLLTLCMSLARGAAPSPVAAARDNLHWTISLHYAGDAVQPAKPGDPWRPRQMEITKIDKLTKAEVSYQGGTKAEYWQVGNRVLEPATDHKIIVLAFDAEAPPYPYASRGFYGMHNVKEGDLQGEETFEKQKCLHYSGRLTQGVGENYEAWIDAETKLPVGYREGGVTFIYQFSPPKVSSLQLPADFASAWDTYQQNCAKMGMKP